MLKYFGMNVEVKRSKYRKNDSLAVVLVPEECPEEYSVITKNIDETEIFCCPFNEKAFVDINNYPDIEKFLIENELAIPLVILGQSGHCIYPLYAFDLEKIPEMDCANEDSNKDTTTDNFVTTVEVRLIKEAPPFAEFVLNKKTLPEAITDIVPRILEEIEDLNLEENITLYVSADISKNGEKYSSDEVCFYFDGTSLTVYNEEDDEFLPDKNIFDEVK